MDFSKFSKREQHIYVLTKDLKEACDLISQSVSNDSDRLFKNACKRFNSVVASIPANYLKDYPQFDCVVQLLKIQVDCTVTNMENKYNNSVMNRITHILSDD